MNRKIYSVVLAFTILILGIWPIEAIQLLDVLFLTDGSSVEGVIMEEEPGKSLVIESEDGQLLEYRFKDIERIEKKFLDEEPFIQNRDVIYLKDGVVFRGMIVGRVPEEQITLELEDGNLLRFDMNEIFKIGKEQVATGVVKKAVLKPKKEEKKRIEIQIQIAAGQLDLKQQKLKEGGEASQIESLNAEVDRLKDEIKQMEEQKEEVENEAAEEEAKFAAIESEIGELKEELLDAAAELQQRIAACESPQVKKRLDAKYDDLQRSINELLERAEVVAMVEQPDPRVEEIEIQAKATDVLALAQNRLWSKPEYEEQWKELMAELPHEERTKIFREVRGTGIVGPMVLNAIPFVYIGSWRQKDYLGAAVGLGLNVAALGVWGAEALFVSSTDPLSNTLLQVGGYIMLGAWVFGILEPLFFNTRYNNTLREVLELDRKTDKSQNPDLALLDRGSVFPSLPPKSELRLELVHFEY